MRNIIHHLGVAKMGVFSEEISLNFILTTAASPIQWGFFYALALSGLLAAGGYFALRWASHRSQQEFLLVLIGGFMLRLIIFGIALVWVWKFSRFDGKTFTWTLLISYLLFQLIETIAVQRYFKRMKSTS
jgi:hypothetical protein